MNIIFLMIDSLRADHLGINGNDWIKTPNMDKLGKDSVIFKNAYPESLPTIPQRKSVFTGKRVFPFRDWKPFKHWPVPAWTPLPEEVTTLPEILKSHGYTTAMITDTYHMFKPGMNFHTGFDEWRWIRGQEFDWYRSGCPKPIDIEPFVTDKMNLESPSMKFLPLYLRNVEERRSEEDYFAPQVFRSAIRWLEENHKADKFFLYIDCFDPHEPWDPPQYYVDLYNRGYQGKEVILPIYTDKLDYLSKEELKHVRALYAGEVTMVDAWIGCLLDKVEQLGLMDDTIVVLMSDHGHVLGENGCLGKVPRCLYPSLMDLVFFIKHPSNISREIDNFVYNHEIFSTLFYLIGKEIPEQAEGRNIWKLAEGRPLGELEYVTSRLKSWCWVRDRTYAYCGLADGGDPQLWDMVKDPECSVNLAEKHPDIVKRMHEYLIESAGGNLPEIDVAFSKHGAAISVKKS